MNPEILDQDRFIIGEATPPPVTTTGLLNVLGVSRESREIQQTVIASWLEKNPVNADLKRSLKQSGFINANENS